MKKLIALALCVAALTGFSTQYSKLSIITYAKSVNRWDALKTWIQQAGFYDEWLVCQYLADDYEQFPLVTNAVIQAGIFTTEQISELLNKSVDTSIPDSVLNQKYERDNRTESGRKSWHGALKRQIVSTNDFTRTTVYEDGTVFIDSWSKADINKAVKEYNAKLPIPPMTNGIPLALAEARQRAYNDRVAESNLTVEVTAGK